MSASTFTTAQKTLFVLGAGASHEVQLPAGAEFKSWIVQALYFRFERGSKLVAGDDAMLEALRISSASEKPPSQDAKRYLFAAQRIRDALLQAISIDHLMDAHIDDKHLELCGKLAIVHTILEAERRSMLYVGPSLGHETLAVLPLNQTWFSSFLRLLTENCRKSDLEKRLSSVALVVFNYDRCIEHYLYHALQIYYGISGGNAAALLRRLEIYHPYGTVGSLPWLDKENAIEFGATPSAKQLLSLAAGIKTFAEGTDTSSSEIGAIRTNMTSCNRLVFLGFAFHRMNLDLLLPLASVSRQPTNRTVFGTAFKISSNDQEIIQNELATRAGVPISNVRLRNDLTCYQLFHEFWRSLSLV